MGQVVFRGPSGAPVPHHTPYAKVNYCEYDPDGRKDDPGRTSPPVILAADHADDSKRRFSACFQLHALFNLMKPNASALSTYPLNPTRAQGPNLSPYTYEGLGKLVRRVMAWGFRCRESDPALKPYTAYSLRIGGAIALHDAGADGLVIAAAWVSGAATSTNLYHPPLPLLGYTDYFLHTLLRKFRFQSTTTFASLCFNWCHHGCHLSCFLQFYEHFSGLCHRIASHFINLFFSVPGVFKCFFLQNPLSRSWV
jgi:hypothetical protein